MKARAETKARPDLPPAEDAVTEPGGVEDHPLHLAPPLLIAGPVTSEEELQSVQQIALVTQWMLLFSSATTNARAP